MNKFFVLLFAAFLFVSCSLKSSDNTKDDSINGVNEVLDNWHHAAAVADFETYFNAFSKDAIFIGTDASEYWNKKEFQEYAKPYFDKHKAWNFKSQNRHVHVNGDVAWFDELLDTHMGVCRGSGVLQKENQQWKIKHYVLSLTIPNSKMKRVSNFIKEKDTILLK